MGTPSPGVLGKYQLLDRLAIGGMAELYKARVVGARGFEKAVVIKRILPHLAADPSFVEMFVDEARITARLEHPKIVQVYELGNDGEQLYIVMQYVDGMDVLGLLRECARTQQRLPPELAAFIAHEVLDALDFAHKAREESGAPLGIVHRDISPGNVLISRHGDVKITDFGIARAAERKHKTEAGTLKGKYGYMSPEQVSGIDVDARADVFSLGIVLAEMLMGHRLFTAPSDLDVLLMVRDARIERLHKYGAHIPPSLLALVERALRRRPSQRWPDAGAFRDALAEWLHAQGRLTGRGLAEFVDKVLHAPTVDIDKESDGIVTAPVDEFGTLSGPSTRMHNEEAAQAARAGRARYLMGTGVPGQVADDEDSAGVVVIEQVPPAGGAPLAVPAVLARPGESGNLREVSPLRLLHRLAHTGATGLLILEGRAGILKEAYLAEGHPQFVTSNVMRERLGEYLVEQNAISQQSLQRALSVMPHFSGRLADTLVGLGLMGPLEAFRALVQQVSAKLIDVCTWQKGKYRWFPGRENPWPARPLHLDTFRVLGAGALAIETSVVEEWAHAQGGARVTTAPTTTAADVEVFGLGEAATRVLALLDGSQTLAELEGRFRSPDARANFLKILHLIVQSELAVLE